MRLDDTVALKLLDPSRVEKFLEAKSYSSVFVCVLLFSLAAVYGDTSEI